eukprot:GILJ01011783.1.p1 GENE.GILJ01011783.1~~GILJ01011783.1.p1  ORF type:complete len:181 (-),score=36.94 GILJ01011783.1:344-886(-)
MAAQMPVTVSSFPPPPPFYKEDGYENRPPPPPISGTFSMFGRLYTTEDILPTLADQQRQQLFPDDPNLSYKDELKKLNRSVVHSIVELLDILTKSPAKYKEKVEDIELLFLNMHHLLNSLRPHQARSNVISMLQAQIDRRRQLCLQIDESIRDSEKLIKEAHAAAMFPDDTSSATDPMDI